MDKTVLDHFEDSGNQGKRLLFLMCGGWAIITLCFWGIAFVPLTSIGGNITNYRALALFVLAGLVGYFFTWFSIRLNPKIGRLELLWRLSIVWIVPELIYHGIDKMIIYQTPVKEVGRIILYSFLGMTLYSGIGAMIVFARFKRTQITD